MTKPIAMKTAYSLAFCLTVSILAYASAAHADSGYSPYYVQDRDKLLYMDPMPPQTAGVVAVPQQNPGHVVDWQPPTTTLQPTNVPDFNSDKPALYRFNNQAWVSAGTTFFNYKESVSPIPDSEKGFLPSIAAGVDFMTQNNLYLSLEGSDAFGTAPYNGAIFDTNTNTYDIPYQSKTRETIVDADGKIGQGFYVANNTMFIPYLDLGWHYWDRDLGLGQTEEYHNFNALGGIKLEYAATERLTFMGYGAGGTTMGGKMISGGSSFDLGSAAMEQVGGKVGYDLTPRISIFSTIDYTHFCYSSSPVVSTSPTTGAMEPGSKTEDTTMRVGLGYHFR